MTRRLLPLLFPVTLSVVSLHATVTAIAQDPLVFISSFAKDDEGAIHVFRFDSTKGQWKRLHRFADQGQPFFMALSPSGRFLYTTHAPTTFGGADPEYVVAHAVNDDGSLTVINRQSSHGKATCYLFVDATEKALVAANYSTGNVSSYPLQSDGQIGPAASILAHQGSSVDPERQQHAFAHCILPGPNNRFVFAADLGTDQLLIYELQPQSAKLAPARQPFVRLPPGSGPRHLVFHPQSQRIYVINELANTVTVFDADHTQGWLIERQSVSTLPPDFQGTSYCADLKITPDGRFLYATNRGHDSLACYSISEVGSLSLIDITSSLGEGPQNLAITQDGKWLLCANMPGNRLVVFSIDADTGRLTQHGDPLELPGPSCIQLRYNR